MYISIGKFIETPFIVQIHNQTGGDKRVKNDNTVTTLNLKQDVDIQEKGLFCSLSFSNVDLH